MINYLAFSSKAKKSKAKQSKAKQRKAKHIKGNKIKKSKAKQSLPFDCRSDSLWNVYKVLLPAENQLHSPHQRATDPRQPVVCERQQLPGQRHASRFARTG